LNDYYSGGYFVIRAWDPPGWDLPPALFPDRLLSLSRCICPRLDLWWGRRTEVDDTGTEFGIPAERWADFVAWCQHGYQTEADYLTGMFYSVEAARRFIRRFLPDTLHLYLIGVGFPRELADPGLAGNSDIAGRIAERLPLEAGGEALGHEVVSFEHDLGHSWVCNHIYEEPFGFNLNRRGLIDSLDDARKVYAWIAEDNLQGLRGEPEPYYVWQLVSYPLV
jgi:hypothetical protein